MHQRALPPACIAVKTLRILVCLRETAHQRQGVLPALPSCQCMWKQWPVSVVCCEQLAVESLQTSSGMCAAPHGDLAYPAHT